MTLILLALLVAQAPAESDREAIRKRLREFVGMEEGWGHCRPEVARMAQAALDELPTLIKEAKGEHDVRGFLLLFACVAEMKGVAQSPSVILNLARSGSELEHCEAAKVALSIRDDRAIAYLVESLGRMAADECTSQRWLENALIERAGWSNSKEAGEALRKLLASPDQTRKFAVIQALGDLGHAPALDELKALAGPRGRIPAVATGAVGKIEMLASPDRMAKLLEIVRSVRTTGEFSWREWGLHQLLRLNPDGAAEGLRAAYDDLRKKDGDPKDGGAFGARLLHAILKLGGKLGPGESALLHELGRLPPAEKLPPEPDAAFMKGFDKSVWAPLAERQKEAAARNAPPPRIPEDKLPKFMKDRIKFVMNLKDPDPSYLAPNAALALETIEEMLPAEADPVECGKLLTVYHYLARLREGMKTPEHFLTLAGGPPSAIQERAAAIVTTIADDRAEAWFLERFNGPKSPFGLPNPGRLSGPKVKEALVKRFLESDRDRLQFLEALVDRGCVEILPELRKMEKPRYEIRFAIERLEIFESPDRDVKLLGFATTLARSGNFSWADWGLDQVVRLELKHLAPDLRKWYDAAKLKWAPSHDPHRLTYKMPWVLFKLGAPITPEEEALLKQSGRRP